MAVREEDVPGAPPPLGGRSPLRPGEGMAPGDDREADRLPRQLRFLLEMDRLKQILRRTSVGGEARRENSAEHSWHLAMMAPVLEEHAAEPVELRRVVRMALIHDVVEIDAGDTFAFDAQAQRGKEARERAAADRIFTLLPEDQAVELRALWEEFEEGRTPEARFANALDRLAGLLQNHRNGGGTWLEHDVDREAILARMEPIRKAMPGLWPWVLQVVDEALAPRR